MAFLNRQSHKKCIANNYLLTLVHYAQSKGVDMDDFLSDANMTLAQLQKKRAYTSFEQYVVFIRAFLSRCHKPGVAFDVIQRVEVTEHGLLGVAVLCGLNLGQALKIVLKFSKLQSNLLDITMKEQGESVVLTLQPNYQMDQAVLSFTMAMTLATFFKSKQDLTGVVSCEHAIHVNYPVLDSAPSYHAFFGDDVVFDADEVSFSFPKSQLKDKLQLANRETHEMMVEQCEQAMPVAEETDVVNQVRHLLKQSAVDFPTQDDVADQLHLSTRSLRRHLQQHQMTYQQLLDGERIDRAKTLLRYSDLSITTIAAQVGYSDSANFSKAFKKSMGMSPSNFRESWDPDLPNK